MSPLETIGAAMGRLAPNSLQDARLSAADDASRDVLYETGRWLLEDLQDAYSESNGSYGWHHWAQRLAERYTQQVKEVVG